MAKTRKTLTVTVKLSVPSWLPAAAARKEVRTLINAQAFWGHRRGGWSLDGHPYEDVDETNFRCIAVTPARR